MTRSLIQRVESALTPINPEETWSAVAAGDQADDLITVHLGCMASLKR